MQEPLYSKSIQTKSKTYFFDLKEAKNKNKYVSISEVRTQDGQKVRQSIAVFSDQYADFSKIIEELKEKMKPEIKQ